MEALLTVWNPERRKQRYLKAWLQHLVLGGKVDRNFQSGVELVNLAPDVASRFSEVVIPLVRSKRPDLHFHCFSAQLGALWAVRFKVRPRSGW